MEEQQIPTIEIEPIEFVPITNPPLVGEFCVAEPRITYHFEPIPDVAVSDFLAVLKEVFVEAVGEDTPLAIEYVPDVQMPVCVRVEPTWGDLVVDYLTGRGIRSIFDRITAALERVPHRKLA